MTTPGRPGVADAGAAIAHDLGVAMTPLGAIALPTLVIALVNAEWSATIGIAVPVLAAVGGAAVARLTRRRRGEARPSHVPLMAGAWLLASFVCAVPYLAAALRADAPSDTTAAFADPLNALFESMSGLTSTGLTVSVDPRELPFSLQRWRSATQWLGGVGILYVVLGAVVPDGKRADPGQDDQAGEESNEDDDSDAPPGLRAVVRRTWLTYAILTAASFLAFWLCGMSLWDAANHAQTAVSTAGFSLSPDSLAAYPASAQAAAVGSMIAGSIPFFTLRRLVLKGDLRALLWDRQARWLLAILAGGSTALWAATYLSAWDAVFQWATALCTCGFSTVAVEELGSGALLAMSAAMILGASAGSTAGGIKLARLRRLAFAALGRGAPDPALAEPAGKTRRIAVAFVATYAVGVGLMFLTCDAAWDESAFEAASAIGTVGLSAGVTAPDLPAAARLVLVGLMWLGRLEVMAVVAVLARASRVKVR